MKRGTQWRGREPMKPHLISEPRQTSLNMYVLCVHQRSRQAPMNLKVALTALVTLCHAKMAGDLRPLWSPKGMPKWRPAWNLIICQILANDFGLGHLRCFVSGHGIRSTNPCSTGPQGPLFGVTLGSHKQRHTF